MDNRARPRLYPAFLDEVKQDWKGGGIARIVPWLAVASGALGLTVAMLVPDALFKPASWGSVAAIYAGVLTFNGITLALTWTAIGKIYETISRSDFSRFLRAGGVLGTYLFYIHFMHMVQVAAACAALTGLFVSFVPAPEVVYRIVMGLMVATTLYALRWAVGSVTIVQDLSWRFSTFDGLTEEEKSRVWLAASNGT